MGRARERNSRSWIWISLVILLIMGIAGVLIAQKIGIFSHSRASTFDARLYQVMDVDEYELELEVSTGTSDTVERCEVTDETRISVTITCRGLELRGGNQNAAVEVHKVRLTLDNPLDGRKVLNRSGTEIERILD